MVCHEHTLEAICVLCNGGRRRAGKAVVAAAVRVGARAGNGSVERAVLEAGPHGGAVPRGRRHVACKGVVLARSLGAENVKRVLEAALERPVCEALDFRLRNGARGWG